MQYFQLQVIWYLVQLSVVSPWVSHAMAFATVFTGLYAAVRPGLATSLTLGLADDVWHYMCRSGWDILTAIDHFLMEKFLGRRLRRAGKSCDEVAQDFLRRVASGANVGNEDLAKVSQVLSSGDGSFINKFEYGLADESLTDTGSAHGAGLMYTFLSVIGAIKVIRTIGAPYV